MSGGSGGSGLSDYASPPFSISSRPEKPTNRPVISIPINRFIHRVELAQVTSRFFFNVETLTLPVSVWGRDPVAVEGRKLLPH